MKKTIMVILSLTVVLSALFAVPASAYSEDYPLLIDDADVLTEDEEENLLAKLVQITERYECDVAIVTVNGLQEGYDSIMEYADDLYDYRGYGYGSDDNGILLLIDMQESEYWMSTFGSAIRIFYDDRIDYLGTVFERGFRSDKYGCLCSWADECERCLLDPNGENDVERTNEEQRGYKFSFGHVVIALIVGVIFAAAKVGSMTSQMKTAVRQNAANSYVRENSLNLTKQKDIFMHSNVTKTARETDSGSRSGGHSSSTHTSSSGRSHGGGGGHF